MYTPSWTQDLLRPRAPLTFCWGPRIRRWVSILLIKLIHPNLQVVERYSFQHVLLGFLTVHICWSKQRFVERVMTKEYQLDPFDQLRSHRWDSKIWSVSNSAESQIVSYRSTYIICYSYLPLPSTLKRKSSAKGLVTIQEQRLVRSDW